MKTHFSLTIVFLLSATAHPAFSYDPNFHQRVKHHQQKTKWAIKKGKYDMQKRRAERERERERRRSSSSRSSSSRASSSSRSSSSATRNSNTPTTSPKVYLQTFITACNRAKSLDQLHPYVLSRTAKRWSKMTPKNKQTTLMNLKKWTNHARVQNITMQKAAVCEIKVAAPGIKAVNLWAENKHWKYSNTVK